VAIIGDAELDEGNMWEAVCEDHMHGLGNLLWIVDLNRQSLDRVIPGIRAGQLEAIFRATGWQVIEVKYGRWLQSMFSRPGGEALRRRIDDMSNEEYQAMIRLGGHECREEILTGTDDCGSLKRLLADVTDEDLPGLLSDLGGHDFEELLAAFTDAGATQDRPTVIFAYTIKGWGLPIAAHPLNHRALLTDEQIEDLRKRLQVPADDEWARFPAGSAEEQACKSAAERLKEPPPVRDDRTIFPADVPLFLDHRPVRETSTQDALGRLLYRLAEIPKLGERIVTVAPDVAVSTNLGGWINKVGAYSARVIKEYERSPTEVRWESSPQGQHIELGISEMNMFLLLAMLGLSKELVGRVLLPIGTVYDPFLLRGLDGLIYGLYSESKFIVVGTPSGVSLSPEGGAHQSTVTPALGIGLPNLISYEPAFAREVEWVLLAALRECLDRAQGRATYLRLSTKPIEQSLLDAALARLGEEELRRQVLAGGYRLVDSAQDAPETDPAEMVHIAVCGVMVPEAVAAARELHGEGVAANVLAITSADRLYAALAAERRGTAGDTAQTAPHIATLIPPAERHAPIVTVMDGMSHTLTFLGGAFGVPVVPLGVDAFGQSGNRADLYRHYGIDKDSIVAAAYRALDMREG
jgi:pyruvate dehydrogenase E1 component